MPRYPHLSVQDVRRLLACDGLRGRDQSGAVGTHGLDGQTLPSKVRSPAGTRFDKLSSRRRKFSSLPFFCLVRLLKIILDQVF